MLAFATDLYDEGLDTVLENIQERAGVDGLTLAVAYHDARDLTIPSIKYVTWRVVPSSSGRMNRVSRACGSSPASPSPPGRGILSANFAWLLTNGECR